MVNPLRWLRADMKARKDTRQMIASGMIQQRSVLDLGDLWKKGLESLAVRSNVTDPMTQVGVVYTAISILMASMASVNYGLTDGEDAVDDHPFYDLMSRPNDYLIGTQLIEGTVCLREMKGRAFWLLDGMAGAGRTRMPRAIQLLDPDRVKAKLAGGELVSWEYQPKLGGAIQLSLDEVIRFNYFDHRDPYGGMAPLEAARLGYSLNWKSSRMQELFYQNGGLPPFFISYPPGVQVTADQKKSLRDEFREKYLGLSNQWTPPSMFGGAELKSISVNQRDAEWMNTQKVTTWEVLNIFGVPPEIAGYTEDANRSVSVEARRRFWAGKIRGMGEHFESVIQVKLIDRFWDGLDFGFDWSAKYAEVMPEELRASVDTAIKLIGVGVPPSEAFRFLDIPIDVQGKPWLDEGWLAFSMQRASLMMQDAPADTTTPADSTDTQPTDTTQESGGARRHAAWPQSEKLRAALWRTRAATMEKSERRMLGEYRGFLVWLRNASLSAIRSDRMSPTGYEGIDVVVRDDETLPVPPPTQIHKEVVERTRPSLVHATKSGWLSVLEELGSDATFNPNDPHVAVLLAERMQEIKGASDTIAARLRESLRQGLDAGETPNQLAERVRSVITEAYSGQARVVARTETGAAFEGARFESMKAEGVTRHEWLSARDERVRESHQIDGEDVVIGQPFSNGLVRPHAPGAPAGEVINCRCVTLPILED